ncbi:DUF6352 family protein [Pararhodobacter sp. SW119]|uniref:DUF6352 family protein n=1 Tax=Pararhodobacter sp. SW119 TaxID=2780075 RepID=UPI001ADEF05F|nr:DUF6352 family protein [Pararhodobacter sp. SW119]
MPEFWVASGHHLTRLDARGWMQVTDALLLAWFARPEVLPPPEACPAERALHARLIATPRAPVSHLELAALADPDARENWTFLLDMRDRLLRAGTIEGGYLSIVREGRRFPVVLLNQLVQLILRNALEGCEDAQVLRAAELMFRPQHGHVKDDRLLLADEELVQLFEAEMHASPLTAMFSGGVDGLDVLGGGNEWTYWSRSDAHTTLLNFGGDPAARAGLARAIEAFLAHLLGLQVTVTPQLRADDIDLHWFVGLDPAGTAIGNALWRGETPRDTLVGLYRLDFADPAPVRADIAGHPVWLILGLAPDGGVRMKPQNLVVGLPLKTGDPVH